MKIDTDKKRSGGKQTPDQVLWQDVVNASGGLAVVVTSVDELRKQLRDAGYQVP